MSTPRIRHSAEEVGVLGNAAYARYVRPHVRPEDDGKCVVINVDTGEYEIGGDDVDVEFIERFRARSPVGDLWMTRVNRRAFAAIGASLEPVE